MMTVSERLPHPVFLFGTVFLIHSSPQEGKLSDIPVKFWRKE
jgi:hypothetical protein